MPFSLLFSLLASLVSNAIGDEVRISSVDGLIEFKDNVNSGTTYSGTTVFLDSDLSLTDKEFEPIGHNSSYCFKGTFDGQGYVISNLAISSSSSQYTGLFGHSEGPTIKNVILDSSCSITSSFSDPKNAYVGGIVGDFRSGNKISTIENSVSMASVSFIGNVSDYSLYIGGIAGYTKYSFSYGFNMTNCANYGDVTHSGTSESSYIGGVIGYFDGFSRKTSHIYNSLNAGTVTHSGTTSWLLYLGGVVGHADSGTDIDNCVSAGRIESTGKAFVSYIGSIAGETWGGAYINHCYVTSELSSRNKYGSGSPTTESNTLSYDSSTLELSGTVSAGDYTGTSLINALNAADYYDFRGYSRWLLNKNGNTVTFKIGNDRTATISLSYQIMLLPSLAVEGATYFYGWYEDSTYATPLASYEITSDIALYGKQEENTNSYTIAFVTRREGVSIPSISAQFGSVVTLPNVSTADGHCSIGLWETEYGDYVGMRLTITAHEITLYAAWKCTHIKTPEDFVDFSKVVNSGVDYAGMTVFLDSDLSLSGKAFEPIGNSGSNYFKGTFDGQGHAISNLEMASSSIYIGLFGYSYGLTIKNVIIDSSCSITTLNSGSDHYLGGIIGECYAGDRSCIIENSVNMASISFTNSISSSLYLGGIAGELYSSRYDSTVKNCANYGDLTHSGESGSSYIGGIVGYSDGFSSDRLYVYNSLNYGKITYTSTKSSSLSLGGIAGNIDCTTFENCVSAGKIESSGNGYIGSIAGKLDSGVSFKYCYFTSELSSYKKYGDYFFTPGEYNITNYDSTTFELNGTAFIGDYKTNSLIDALNVYSDRDTLSNYSHWLLNKNSNTVTFTINNDRTIPITMNYQIMLLPSLVSEGNMSFDGWYEDSSLTTPFTSHEITSDTALYGRWEEGIKYTIILDTRREGLSVDPITAQLGSAVTLPSGPTREHCSVALWENKYGDKVGFSLIMPEHNITLYAVWKCTHIKTPDDLVDLSKIVNSGTDSFSGTTVFLDSDLSLSGKKFEPIGNTTSNDFLGVFDGQGYVISNLAVNLSSAYAGLFGYSNGLTIRNAILDSSCSITSSCSGSRYVYAGGLVGYCSAGNRRCIIENSVNMASVSFTDNIGGYSLYLGGISGYLYSYYYYYYESSVKNCANYGDVTHSGKSGSSYIGGIVGHSQGSLRNKVHIYNSLNYGTIAHNGTTSNNLHLGGIAGYAQQTAIESCASAGKISSTETATNNHIGSVVGYASDRTSINYCYVTSELSSYGKYEGATQSEPNIFSYDSTTFELDGTASIGEYIGTSLIDTLNAAADYYFFREYSHWLLNKNSKTVSFTINGRTIPISMNSQVMLLPSLAVEGNMSFVWYEDSSYATPLTSYEVTSDKALYGKTEVNANNYTITFNTRKKGVSVEPITAQFGSVVTLPSASTAGDCSVGFWETEHGDYVGMSLNMPEGNIVLYAVWKCTHIKTPEDLIDLSKVVNNRANTFRETTVFLDSDLSFEGKAFESIGIGNYNYFIGTFDGQGYVISNLAINSSLQSVGLFGYSNGLTIRNVILDSSCLITSSYSSSGYAHLGGLIGECSGPCTIENNVNMASVSFTGNMSSYSLYIGGIAGSVCSSYYYNSTVVNCANYGDVTHSGKSSSSYIGGIIGYPYGYSTTKRMYIYNSLNYGTITHSGKTIGLYVGGITGYAQQTTIESCVSAGDISTITAATNYNHIGSSVGHIYSDTSIDYCYVTSELSRYNECGYGTPSSESNSLSYDSTTFELDEAVSIGEYTGTSLINALNAAADYYVNYSHWLLNKNNNTVSFTISGRTVPISMNYQIMLLPSLVSEGNMNFGGWYEDSDYATPLTSYEVKGNTVLYGKYCGPDFVVTLNANKGNVLAVKEMTIGCKGTYGEFPEATRTGYTLDGWFTEKTGGEKVYSGDRAVILSNHTLYAQWTINQYTITFETNGGSECEPITQDYNTAVTLPSPNKTGNTFAYWCSDPELTTKYTATAMPSKNKTLYAKWTANQYTITFDFYNNGTVSSVMLEFNATIEYPEDVTREGFTFIGWSPRPERMPAEDITVKAQWSTANPTECVEIVFSQNLTEERIEEIIKEFVPEGTEFAVVKIEGTSEGTTIIIRFTDKKKAKEFAESVVASSDAGRSGIKSVGFVPGGCSFSPSLGLSVLVYFLSYLLFF